MSSSCITGYPDTDWIASLMVTPDVSPLRKPNREKTVIPFLFNMSTDRNSAGFVQSKRIEFATRGNMLMVRLQTPCNFH
jgi:hypothetical protein